MGRKQGVFPLFSSPALATPLALSTVSATIVCGFLLVRFAGSRARLAAREREYAFEDQLEAFVGGTLRGRELLRAASELDSDLFWDAVSSRHAVLGRRAFRDLEPALERSRHVTAERRALRDSAPVRRELAARRLMWLGARRHYRALRRAMIAGPESATLAAAMALARARDGAAFRWLLTHPRMLEHRPPQARLALLRAFGPRFVQRLATALEVGIGEPRMERAVIETLALAGHRPATPSIARRLRHEWRDVRVAAVRALGHLHAVEHLDGIVRAISDGEWQVRAQAAVAVGRMGNATHVPALRQLLRDPAWWVRRHAAYALANLGDDGMAALREAAAGDPDRYARDIASEALAGGFPGRASA